MRDKSHCVLCNKLQLNHAINYTKLALGFDSSGNNRNDDYEMSRKKMQKEKFTLVCDYEIEFESLQETLARFQDIFS